MIDEGTATYLGSHYILHGTKHKYMFGEVLAVNQKGSLFVRRFPWKRQYDKVNIKKFTSSFQTHVLIMY